MRKLYIVTLLTIISFSANAQWQPSSGCCIWATCFAVNGDSIFAGDAGGYGVYLSPNNGNTWSQSNTGLPTYTYVYALANKRDTIFAGTYYSGIYLSLNGGNSWNAVNTGLTKKDVNALAIKGNIIYAGTDSGGVFLSTNNGGLWNAVNTGLTNNFVRALTIKGDSIFAGTNGGVFMSSNNGGLWSATSLTDTVQAFAINGNNIFAGTNGDGIYLSTNGGNSWNLINSGLIDHHVRAFAIDSNNIFAGTGGVFSNGYGVFMSSNNGGNWAAVNTGLNDFWALNINALVINKDTLFSGTDSIIWERPLSQMTGIKEINNNEGNIAVYPNPATNTITINIPKAAVGSEQSAVIVITNIQGQLIKTLTTSGIKTNIDVSTFPNGVYLIKVITEKGIEVKKFVKE